MTTTNHFCFHTFITSIYEHTNSIQHEKKHQNDNELKTRINQPKIIYVKKQPTKKNEEKTRQNEYSFI